MKDHPLTIAISMAIAMIVGVWTAAWVMPSGQLSVMPFGFAWAMTAICIGLIVGLLVVFLLSRFAGWLPEFLNVRRARRMAKLRERNPGEF